MRSVRIFQVDAFTDTAFTGNPAGVVLGAEQLDEAEMQAIARELNNGDSAFVLPPASDGEDLQVRFFTPRKEAPFVGHATLAVHAVLQRDDPRPLRRQGGRTDVVEVRAADGTLSISQPPPVLGRTLAQGELEDVLGLLDLAPGQLDPACPARIVGSSSTRLLIGLRDTAALDGIKPRLAALATLSPRIGAQGYFVFVRSGETGKLATQSRMFCPALGIDEDPVSGNAHAMLGVHLRELGLLPGNPGSVARFSGAQGRHVGRPGKVEVEISLQADGSAQAATISGRAVIVFETEITLA